MGIICWPAHLISISQVGQWGRNWKNGNRDGAGWSRSGAMVNCWGPPVTNFDYETWQLVFFFSCSFVVVVVVVAGRLKTTPKALLIFVPHKTQPPGQRSRPGWAGYGGRLISFRIFIASCPGHGPGPGRRACNGNRK